MDLRTIDVRNAWVSCGTRFVIQDHVLALLSCANLRTEVPNFGWERKDGSGYLEKVVLEWDKGSLDENSVNFFMEISSLHRISHSKP